ncbi:MAG: beta-galactosidase [Muribaculaceae bacterium]|nr:beta-galactosidase [Muribaculaceae bacterium]
MSLVKKFLRCVAVAALLSTAVIARAYDAYTPVSYPKPASVSGKPSALINLDGRWQFRFSPKSKWTSIEVPGEAAMQGYGVPHDSEVIYKRSFRLPASFANQRTVLRFNGTYSYANLLINGKKVRDHRGGFSQWDTDITPFVKPGRDNTIELRLSDPLKEVSYGSGYAHHPICGILRSVEVFAVPAAYITDLRVDTRMDSTYTDADLRLDFNFTGSADAKASLTLTAPDGKQTHLAPADIHPGPNTISYGISRPVKWDAEHPNLYTASIELTAPDGTPLATIRKQIGFRSVEIRKDRMFVNGRQVKLRGACRHDVDPLRGRSTDRATDSIDALLFKQANMNFVRTSHYPPSEDFIEFCDRFGIYVECETAACFVDTHRQKNYAPGASQSDPEFTAQYVGQLAEMIQSFQTHPSILFWSIGNESKYGSNFQKCHDFATAYDSTRPVIWSYPGYQPKDTKPIYDILSMHYPDVYGNLWQVGKQTRGFQGEGIPAIFDEWAHPACYTHATLRDDPNIREFWGKSLDMMWDGVYNAPGALGGAIWGYIDDVFPLPAPKAGTDYWREFARTDKPEEFNDRCVGYGDWGIVDIWRRQKPEFWATKKAYSPVRIETPKVLETVEGQPVRLTVFNRFDHTNLNEIKGFASWGNESVELETPDVMPHNRATITVPALSLGQGDSLRVAFTTAAGDTIDSYLFTAGAVATAMPAPSFAGPLAVENTDLQLIIKGDGFTVPLDKSTGLITDATVGGKVVIESGPYFNGYINLNHLSGAEVRAIADHIVVDSSEWKLTSMKHTKIGDNVKVDVRGTYGKYVAEFNILISPEGEISTSYVVDGLPNGYLREEGLLYRIPDSFSTLSWERTGYWDDYPADAMSGNKATLSLYNPDDAAYREKPTRLWRDDTHDYFYWGDRGAACDNPLTMGAKAMKENVQCYTLSGSGNALSVISAAGDVACRLNKNSAGALTLYVDNRWDYPEIAWGNYCKTLEALPCHGLIRLQLNK